MDRNSHKHFSCTNCDRRYSVVLFAGSALSDDQLLLLSPEELCKDRLSDEYFRLKADSDGGDCRDVVRLVDAVRCIPTFYFGI